MNTYHDIKERIHNGLIQCAAGIASEEGKKELFKTELEIAHSEMMITMFEGQAELLRALLELVETLETNQK